ncbi:MAG: hypothetical protein HC852_15120 [Acaryochloridaceae cyanobacterium RU_4_10]|nr:hypothetical protein [Acaryochloridaceae cyanobacterium RU_4_10]
MSINPFLPSPDLAKAWSEGFLKGFIGKSSIEASDSITVDSIDAFNTGVLTGEEASANGLELTGSCIIAPDEHGLGHVVGMAINGLEIVHGVWELARVELAAGFLGIAVALFELAATLPHHVEDPELVLPRIGRELPEILDAYGLPSMELFWGVGLDALATDCEILLSPLFKSFDQAREAAITMERPIWLVASWRTDQSNSFRVVDSL